MRNFSINITARFFSNIRGSLPSWLRDKTQDVFSKYPANTVFKYQSDYIEKSASKISEALSKKAEQGCEESKKFSSLIEEFHDPKNTTMLVENFPKDVRAVNFLSHIIAIFFDPKLRYAESFFKKTNLLKTKNIPPHSDGSATNADLKITSVGAILSNGSTETGFINVSNIESKLSETAKEILRQPAFIYLDLQPYEVHEKSSFNMPILYHDEDGLLNINLFLGTDKNLFYDENKIPYHQSQIDSAINEIYQAAKDLEIAKETKSFPLKTGEDLFMKNKRGLHFVKYPDHSEIDQSETSHPSPETHRYVTINSYEKVAKVKDITRERAC